MYFKLFKPQSWRKRAVKARWRNYAVLPYIHLGVRPRVVSTGESHKLPTFYQIGHAVQYSILQTVYLILTFFDTAP